MIVGASIPTAAGTMCGGKFHAVFDAVAGHGVDTALERTDREPEFEVAQLLHAAPPTRRLVAGPIAITPKPSPLLGQPGPDARW